MKKVCHNEGIFMEYISIIVTEAVALSTSLHAYL